jgi:hypothetical protein
MVSGIIRKGRRGHRDHVVPPVRFHPGLVDLELVSHVDHDERKTHEREDVDDRLERRGHLFGKKRDELRSDETRDEKGGKYGDFLHACSTGAKTTAVRSRETLTGNERQKKKREPPGGGDPDRPPRSGVRELDSLPPGGGNVDADKTRCVLSEPRGP